MTLFNVWLHFSPVSDSGVKHAVATDFLEVLPRFLKHICKADITFDVSRVYLSGPSSFTVVAELTVTPPPSECVSDDDARRFGIKDPEKTRATTALMLWLNSLRRLGAGPLFAAWGAYCRQKALQPTPLVPVMLMSHGFKEITPPPSPPDLLAIAGPAEAPPKVDPVAMMHAALYDGSTQTTT